MLGSRTVFVGRVGSSSEGKDILDNLKAMGVDTRFVHAGDSVASGEKGFFWS